MSMRRRLGLVATLVVCLAVECLGACAGARPGSIAIELRRQLEASGLERARPSAPDLVAAALAALRDAERAEQAGRLDEAGDHATRARLLADAALAERERIAADEERVELERRAIELEEARLRDERQARQLEQETARLVAARAARQELERALELAERDEARPARRRRISLGDDGRVRRAATMIRERARLLAAAATAMGAEATAVAEVESLATRSAEAPPLEALSLAEQAHRSAQLALASARRARPGPNPEELASALEAAQQQGVRALQTERGLALEVDDVFVPGSARPSARASARIARLARIALAHPHGPIALEIDVSGAGERASALAARRGEWARRALLQAGIAPDRLVQHPPETTAAGPDPGDRVRLVLLAYAASSPDASPQTARP